MDLKEYISSGIIERYVLDSVSSQERQEVECMSHIYPEIGEEVTKLQMAIEQMAIKSAVTPPIHLKTNLLAKVNQTTQEPAKTIVKKEKSGKVVQMNTSYSEKSGTPIFKILAAASIAGIVALGFYTFQLNAEKTELSSNVSNQASEIAEIKKDNQALELAFNELSNKNKISELQLAFLKDVNVSQIPMKGTENHPDLLATVYWNTSNEKVMLGIDNLPVPPSDKQYQLWAIVDGSPVDMGVFSMNNETAGFVEMKTTSSSQAFAITLEPVGGSASPTLEDMYVIGYV
jgi:anti-sigma-K factor RskA